MATKGEKMINIKNINAGWLTFCINDLFFRASYLTNVLKDMDDWLAKIIDYKNKPHTPFVLYLDGEGSDLYLTGWRTYDSKLIIIWEEYSKNNNIMIMNFVFKIGDFYDEFEKVYDRIKDSYNENFIMGLYDPI